MNKLVPLAVGFYSGVIINQRYKMPHVYTPEELCRYLKISNLMSYVDSRLPNRVKSEDKDTWKDNAETWMRFKAYERKQWKEQPQPRPQAGYDGYTLLSPDAWINK